MAKQEQTVQVGKLASDANIEHEKTRWKKALEDLKAKLEK